MCVRSQSSLVRRLARWPDFVDYWVYFQDLGTVLFEHIIRVLIISDGISVLRDSKKTSLNMSQHASSALICLFPKPSTLHRLSAVVKQNRYLWPKPSERRMSDSAWVVETQQKSKRTSRYTVDAQGKELRSFVFVLCLLDRSFRRSTQHTSLNGDGTR